MTYGRQEKPATPSYILESGRQIVGKVELVERMARVDSSPDRVDGSMQRRMPPVRLVGLEAANPGLRVNRDNPRRV